MPKNRDTCLLCRASVPPIPCSYHSVICVHQETLSIPHDIEWPDPRRRSNCLERDRDYSPTARRTKQLVHVIPISPIKLLN